MPEEVEGASAVSQFGSAADGFGDEMFGAPDGLHGRVAEDEETEERGGKSAASSVG